MIAKIILIVINIIGLGFNIGKHGQEKEGRHNGYIYFISLLVIALLYYYAGVLNLNN